MLELKKLLKNRNNRVMLVILIIGIVIIMLSTMFTETDSRTEPEKTDYIGEEERLGEILSEIKGAGKVSVMISYDGDTTDIDDIGRSISYNDTSGDAKPRGVIVVADGADMPDVRRNLKEAAAAVTGVGANHVCVYDRDTNK